MDTAAIRSNLVSFKWWKSWIMVFIGSAMLAAAFVLFINPYRIVPGGVYGAGVVLHALFPSVQVGTFGLMIDIPLLIIAFRVFGGMFGAKTVFAALVTPVIMNTLTAIIGEDPALMFDGRIDLTNDIIIACIFGGALVGTGVGLVVRTRATTGGTDIIAMLLTKYSRLNFSRSILVVDSLVVVFGIIVLGDWKLPLYSLVTVFVMSRTIDFVIDGASYDKLLFIISDRHDQLRAFILDEMGRGATYIKSSGMYTGNEKEMVFLVVSRREVTTVQNKIKEIDREAFVVVVDAYETFGDGFKSFPEKI
ncbi:MAG: YitT family protein [Rikenellaceae bacterium]|nr:YitT family protein [Rikenellaceae bacterium]